MCNLPIHIVKEFGQHFIIVTHVYSTVGRGLPFRREFRRLTITLSKAELEYLLRSLDKHQLYL